MRAREGAARDDAGQDVGDEIVRLRRRKQVAKRLAAAPDVIDHRMIGVGGGIDVVDPGVLAIMAGEIERELHAGRIARGQIRPCALGNIGEVDELPGRATARPHREFAGCGDQSVEDRQGDRSSSG